MCYLPLHDEEEFQRRKRGLKTWALKFGYLFPLTCIGRVPEHVKQPFSGLRKTALVRATNKLIKDTILLATQNGPFQGQQTSSSKIVYLASEPRLYFISISQVIDKSRSSYVWLSQVKPYKGRLFGSNFQIRSKLVKKKSSKIRDHESKNCIGSSE